MQTVYLDVLMVQGLCMTWAMLRGCGILSGQQAGRGRMALGSLMGGLSEGLLLLPRLPLPVWMAVRLGLAAGLCLLTYGRQKGRLLRMTMLLFLVSLLFAGGMVAIQSWCIPQLQVRNGAVYFPLSALTTLGAAGLGCCSARLVREVLERRLPDATTRRYILSVYGHETTVTLYLDTGNRLRYGGRPVAVVRQEVLEGVLPKALLRCGEDLAQVAVLSPLWQRRLRLVPCQTAAGEKLLPAVPGELRGREGRLPCLLAFCPDCFEEGVDGVWGRE